MSARTLPGFRPALGFTIAYLSLLVLIPLTGVFLKSTGVAWSQYWHIVSNGRAVASYRLTLGAAGLAALINAGFGLLVAWVLVRYEFPGRRLLDAPLDLPAAVPTAGAGISLTALYAENGWLGAMLAKAGIKVAFTPLGILVALTFIGLPFVVRTVQPVLQDLEKEIEEAAASLGANRWKTVTKVIFPEVLPAL